MRWFKHLTSAWSDEKIAPIVIEHGLEIYGFYWRILEIIAAQMDKSSRCYCQYSAKVWGNFAGVSAKKFQKLAGILEKRKLISVEFCENEIRIKSDNLLKYRDEYTSRQD